MKFSPGRLTFPGTVIITEKINAAVKSLRDALTKRWRSLDRYVVGPPSIEVEA